MNLFLEINNKIEKLILQSSAKYAMYIQKNDLIYFSLIT